MNLDAQLSLLQAAEIVRFTDESTPAYLFKHVLTQETAYASLLKKARRDLHLKVAQAIEAQYADRPDEYAALLARHYAAGEDDEKTVEYATRAGDADARVHANTEAILHYSLAIESAKRLARAPRPSGHIGAENSSDAVRTPLPARAGIASATVLRDLYMKRGRAFELASRFSDTLANYAEMQELGRELNDRGLELGALIAQCQVRCIPNPEFDPPLGQSLADDALRLARELGDRAAESKVLWILINLYRFTNRLPLACEVGEQSLKIARELDLREQMAYTLNDLTHAYSFRGNYERARELIQEATQLWRELGNLPMLADSLATASLDEGSTGEFDEAITLSDQAYQISRGIENLWGLAYSRSTVGVVYWARGQVAQALDVMQETLELTKPSGYLVPELTTRTDLGVALGGLGAFEAGLDHARRAYEFGETHYPSVAPYALSALIQIYLWKGDYAQAKECFEPFRSDSLGDNIFTFTCKLQSDVRLAAAESDHARALDGAWRLLERLMECGMWAYIPEGLYFKARAEAGLGQTLAARASLMQARQYAERMLARWQLWQILGALGDIEITLGNRAEAVHLFENAREVIAFIAERAPAALRESFLNLPQVQKGRGHYVDE